jgi:cell division protein FtsB
MHRADGAEFVFEGICWICALGAQENGCATRMDFERLTNGVEEQFRKLLHQYGSHLLVIFVVVLLVHDVFGPHGFLVMRRKQQEIQKVNAQIERLNKENAELDQNVKDLKTDPQTIRKIAREELGLAKPGEIIIKLPAQTPPEPPPAKP